MHSLSLLLLFLLLVFSVLIYWVHIDIRESLFVLKILLAQGPEVHIYHFQPCLKLSKIDHSHLLGETIIYGSNQEIKQNDVSRDH